LGSRIGRRNELRNNLASRAPCRIVEGRQILLHRAAGSLGITISAPILTFDRALLVGIGRNEARINCKAFTTKQIGRNARLDDPLEDATKNISLAKTLVAGTRACRTSDRPGSPVLDDRSAALGVEILCAHKTHWHQLGKLAV
jgi:hypothetical protein